MSKQSRANASQKNGTGQQTVTSQPAPSASGKGNERKSPIVAQNMQKALEKHTDAKDNVSGACDLSVAGKKACFYSLSSKLQDMIKSSVKGGSGKRLNEEQMTATFIVKSMKENKLVDVNKEELENMVKVADQGILEKSSKDSVIKFKDGQTNIFDLLDKRKRTGSGTDGKHKTPTEDNQPLNQSPDQQPQRQNSDLEKKLNDRSIELKEKEGELKETERKLGERDQELLLKAEEYEVLMKKFEDLESENKSLCERYDKDTDALKQEKSKLIKDTDAMKQEISKWKNTVGEKEASLNEKQATLGKMEQQLEEANGKNTILENEVKAQHMQYIEARRALEKANRTIDHMKESHEDAMRHKDNQFKELLADRDDLRHRFSKLAGAKLTDQNPDIADLSDPNRAMKLSEKFGTIYDDQWTDAYEHLKQKKKMSTKDAIALLLDVLKKCEEFCNKLKETQMDSLNNVLLHPNQNVESFGSEPRKHVGGFKEHSRIKSDDKKAVRELRRQIGVRESVLDEVKQVFIQETKSWPEKKNLEGCTPYVQRCAEICWLMVLHDPPLYMKMDVQRGDPFDSSLYSVYSASGDKIDFLVWPPLFNNQGGGLLSKGTAEPMKVVKKT